MKPLQAIKGAASKIAPGRAPHFIEAHVIKALVTLSEEAPVGRIGLAKMLGLSEGSIRTLIRHIEKKGLIRTSREGITLTTSGHRLVSNLKSKIGPVIEIPRSPLTVSAFNIAILVKAAANAVRAGVEQRDAAIRMGAKGATTLVFKNGKLIMPLVEEDVLRESPKIREKLLSELKPEENDVIVIGSADTKLTAEYAAITAALETLKNQVDKRGSAG